MDRNTPIATVVPFRPEKRLVIRVPDKKLTFPDRDLHLESDPLDYRIEDRLKR